MLNRMFRMLLFDGEHTRHDWFPFTTAFLVYFSFRRCALTPPKEAVVTTAQGDSTGYIGKDYLAILAGPPESVKMKSGLVVLAPGKSVGEHSIEQNGDSTVVLPENARRGSLWESPEWFSVSQNVNWPFRYSAKRLGITQLGLSTSSLYSPGFPRAVV